MMMTRALLALSLSLPLLAGCGDLLDRFRGDDAAPAALAPAPVSPIPPASGNTAEALDSTTEAERAAALAAPAPAGAASLGRTIVSLGAVTEQGFWLRSPLVTAAGKGRVETADGKTAAVDLLPGAGGAQLSLAAYRALGLGLTDLVEVTVYAQ